MQFAQLTQGRLCSSRPSASESSNDAESHQAFTLTVTVDRLPGEMMMMARGTPQTQAQNGAPAPALPPPAQLGSGPGAGSGAADVATSYALGRGAEMRARLPFRGGTVVATVLHNN